MREHFRDTRFKGESLRLIGYADAIIELYAKQGYRLTLRQLYYQFVARDIIENTERSYKNLGNLVNNARLAGLLDWDAIEDRTRNLERNAHWRDASDAVEAIRDQFRIDLWESQPARVEVWIEKEALIGVIAETCEELDVPYFACRGYVSQSEQWRAYRRSLDQELVILHFGDHDPSGIDMTRDNQDRLVDLFGGCVDVVRLALNMDQIRELNPPPNPAKVTDSRFKQYRSRFGEKSWELDALEPDVINQLIRDNVNEYIDANAWRAAVEQQEQYRARLSSAVDFVAND